MRILRNGKVTDPAETPDTLVGFVSDNKALRTLAFDLALTDYDRDLMRMMGVRV